MKKINKLLIIILIKISPLVKNDAFYLKLMYFLKMHKKLDFNKLVSFNEKVQWLKLYYRKPILRTMVDKIDSKSYVASIIGDKYIIPTIKNYDKVEQLDFKELPEKCVIKSSHDSGSVFVFDKNNPTSLKKIVKNLTKSMKTNYYYSYREWPYKDIKPRIIVEKYMGDNLLDYKIQCFNGVVDNILVCEGRTSDRGVRYHYFDINWNYLNYCPYSDVNVSNVNITKPNNLSEMIKIAETLSAGLPQARVDLYDIDGNIYFGELTFFTNAGFDDTITEEADLIMGSKLELPIKE